MTDYEGVKAWRKLNPDKVAAQARRYRRKHPDKVKAVKRRYRSKPEVLEVDRLRHQAVRQSDPQGQRERQLRWRRKRDQEQEAQAGRRRPETCEICGEFHLRIVFDHCHVGGHFRGWLCDRCNKMLGLVKDDPVLLRKLASYLEEDHGDPHQEVPSGAAAQRHPHANGATNPGCQVEGGAQLSGPSQA